MQTDYIKQLTKEQNEEFIKQTNNLHVDQKTKQLCLRYFQQYKKALSQSIPLDKLPTVFRCALFIAQNSQCTYNIKGERTRGAIGVSLNQYLKNSQLDDFIIILKDFLRKLKSLDSDTDAQINQIFKKISLLVNFHSKFEKIMQKLDIKQKNPDHHGYSKIFISFVWLLYVDSKNNILKNCFELIENTCMIAHVIIFMMIYSWDYLKFNIFGDKKLTERKQILLAVQQKILEMFIIKNADHYKLIHNSFQEYFENLVNTGVLKLSKGKTDFLSFENINVNYKKLDYYYQKNLTPQDVDQRIFFKDRTANLTPSKFTPFAKQGYTNKIASKPQQQQQTQNFKTLSNNFVDINKENFSSHRVLTYQMIQKSQSQTPRQATNINDIKIPKNIINSPCLLKTPLICNTPTTTGMQMYNYVNDKAKKSKQQNFTQRRYDVSIRGIIETIINKHTTNKYDKSKQMKINLIISWYKLTSEEYLIKNPFDKQNQNIFKSFLALSAELVFFVSNSTISFEDIQSNFDTELLDQWKACDFFLKFDKSMPKILKLHFQDIQSTIISWKIWKDEQIIQSISDFIHNKCNQSIKTDIIDRLFRKLLFIIAYQIVKMSHLIKLEEKYHQSVFDTVKQVLTNNIQIIYERHIDQIILCSLYGIIKCNKIDILFSEMNQKYRENNPNNRNLHEQILYVNMGQNQKSDIRVYYNRIFIPRISSFIQQRSKQNININGNNINPINHQNKSNLLMSPLRFIITKEASSFTMLNKQKANNTKAPQMDLLYAYNESPMLKYEMNNNLKNGPMQSKKVLNFDQQQQYLKKKCLEVTQKDQGLSQANDFISKTFNKKPPTVPGKKESEKTLPLQNKSQHQRSLYQRK